MVKNKLMTSMLAISLFAMPAMVLADGMTVEAAKELNKNAKVPDQKNRYDIEIEKCVRYQQDEHLKNKFGQDMKKEDQEVKDYIAYTRNKEARARILKDDAKGGVKNLDAVIAHYELTHAGKTEKILGLGVLGTAGLITFGACKALLGSTLSALYTKSGADVMMPKIWSYGWKTAVVGASALVLANVATGGMRSITKMGRAVKNNCVVRKVCGWWHNATKL